MEMFFFHFTHFLWLNFGWNKKKFVREKPEHELFKKIESKPKFDSIIKKNQCCQIKCYCIWKNRLAFFCCWCQNKRNRKKNSVAYNHYPSFCFVFFLLSSTFRFDWLDCHRFFFFLLTNFVFLSYVIYTYMIVNVVCVYHCFSFWLWFLFLCVCVCLSTWWWWWSINLSLEQQQQQDCRFFSDDDDVSLLLFACNNNKKSLVFLYGHLSLSSSSSSSFFLG